MSERYNCDVCYEEIEGGHVVEYRHESEFGRNVMTANRSRKHVCDDCWPETDKVLEMPGVLKQLLETVGLVE